MNKILAQDIADFAESFALANDLHEATFLITGSSGLIGSTLIFCLLSLKQDIRIIAPVRNKEKATRVLQEFASQVELIECNLTTFDYDSLCHIDYVVHCAAPTSSKFFVEKPVETFNIIYQGTSALLNFAKNRSLKGFVYLSSLEVYGEIFCDDKPLTEDNQGYLDVMNVRSSYPMAKRATENLCHLYAKEYAIPVKIARLTQTTGAGIAKDDNRIIAQFAKLAATNQDIILHTTGESARPYCYTTDCISAILHILLRGKPGEAYNVANKNTYISAIGMAEFIRSHKNPSIQVKIELNDNMGYAPATKQNLCTKKLEALGWQPQYDLDKIFTRLISYLKNG